MLYIVTDSRRSYPRLIQHLENAAGAQVLELESRGSASAVGIPSKGRIVRRLLSPSLRRLRKRWGGDDVVLAISWYVLPILALTRLRLVPRPRKLVAIGVFVQTPSMRRIINAILRLTMIKELEFIAFSEGERETLIEHVGVPAERVHKLVWGARPAAEVEQAASSGPPYVFTGGYANRDYSTFFAAIDRLEYPVIVVASSLNRLRETPSNVDLRLDVPYEEFEGLLAACHLLVIPLRGTGEASGQSVLVRGIESARPVVGTRHDGLIDYLGEGYSGFVPAEDPEALRAAISRAMDDESFRRHLVEQILLRRRILRSDRAEAEIEILAILRA